MNRRRAPLKPREAAAILEYLLAHRYAGVQADLARRFRVPEATVSRIKNGHAYAAAISGQPQGRQLQPRIVRAVYRYLVRNKHRGAQREIAQRHGISTSTAQRIAAGEAYREVTKDL